MTQNLDKNIKNCLTNSFIETDENKFSNVNTISSFDLEDLQKQASLGIASAQYTLSKYYFDNNLNIDEAKKLLLQAVEAKHIKAINTYVDMLTNGQYFNKDITLAYQYSKQAIELKPTTTNLNSLTNLFNYQDVINELIFLLEQLSRVCESKTSKKISAILNKNINKFILKLKTCDINELVKLTQSNQYDYLLQIFDGVSDKYLISEFAKCKASSVSDTLTDNSFKIFIALRQKQNKSTKNTKKINNFVQEAYDSYMNLLEQASVLNISDEDIFTITESIYELFYLQLLNDDSGLQQQYWAKKMFNACVTLANAGNVSYQSKLASFYKTGFGCDIDYNKYLYWCTKAADKGITSAYFDLVKHYVSKYMSDKNKVYTEKLKDDENIRKIIFYVKKINIHIITYPILGALYITSKDPSEYEQGFKYLKQYEDLLDKITFNASFISVFVYMYLSVTYFLGYSTKRNFNLGVEYFYKALYLKEQIDYNESYEKFFNENLCIIFDLIQLRLTKQEDQEYKKHILDVITRKFDLFLDLVIQGYEYPQKFMLSYLFKDNKSLSLSEQKLHLVLKIRKCLLSLFKYIKHKNTDILDINISCAIAKILIDIYESNSAYFLYAVLRILRKKTGFETNTQYDDIINFANEGLKNGNLYCNYIFALLYHKGIGVAKDEDKANEYIQKSIDQEINITKGESPYANLLKSFLFDDLGIIFDYEYTDEFNKELKLNQAKK